MAKVLVLGSGAREHAIAWKLIQSDQVDHVFVAPGNPGIDLTPGCSTLSIDAEDSLGLLTAAEQHKIDLVVVGPEKPLVEGIADFFRSERYPVFGPDLQGAMIEGSKVGAKELMRHCSVPTARHWVCYSQAAANMAINRMDVPIVIKADGLADGKGVFIEKTKEDARSRVNNLMWEGVLGPADFTVLIEEYLVGTEASLLVVTDGKIAIPLHPARDYKRAYDADQGPNTGGMGGFSPLSDTSWVKTAMDAIVYPILRGLKAHSIQYRGVLYVGLMLTDEGPKVLEFNCRFGDPETQVTLPRLKNDFFELCMAAAQGDLSSISSLEWDERACVGVVLASRGYPGKLETGFPISVRPVQSDDSRIFYAGVGVKDNQFVTSGGRVLTAVALGDTIDQARSHAYETASLIDLDTSRLWHRTDIAQSV